MPLVSPAHPLTHYKLLAFDNYGTLVDWEGGLYSSALALPPFSTLESSNPLRGRAKFLQAYEEQERKLQKAHPNMRYPELLSNIFSNIVSAQNISGSVSKEDVQRSADAFGASVGTWPAFPDTVDAMNRLSKFYKLAPLSNVDKASFSHSHTGPLQNIPLAAIYTAEDIGSYKPDLNNFRYLIEHAKSDFGIEKDEIIHVAQSLFHDHVPRKAAGMEPGVWVDRKGVMGEEGSGEKGEAEGETAEYGWRVNTLGELADMVEEAFGKGKGQ